MHFIVAALGKDCDDFTLHIYASLAEQERKMISERIKAAMARSKSKLGLRHPMKRSKAFRRRIRVLAAKALHQAAMERAEAYRVHIEWALSYPGRYGKRITFNAAAEKPNQQRSLSGEPSQLSSLILLCSGHGIRQGTNRILSTQWFRRDHRVEAADSAGVHRLHSRAASQHRN